MDSISASVVSILQYLVPGFLAAWIFYGLTSHPKPTQFERVVQALIFTLIDDFLVLSAHRIYDLISSYFVLSAWSINYNTVSSTIGALIIGLVASIFANHDYLHIMLRRFGVTSRTSYPSEWFGVFNKKKRYVVLQLKDGRRVYGWPRHWPSDPKQGHFALEQASWLGKLKETKLVTVDTLLIDVQEVRWVEFVEPVGE